MLFKDIIGHHTIKQNLIRTAQSGRISHAQLFIGPSGNGKLALAIAYAQYISCPNKTETDSCGECASCKKYQKLIHPDLHFVFPVVKTTKLKNPVSDDFSKEWREYLSSSNYHKLNDWIDSIGTGKLQGSIYTRESQEIIRKLSMKTYEAEYKVMVIWMVEMLNISSANKLLKIIEEPPPKTIFLMVSETPDKLLKTILSRTQMIQTQKINNQELSQALIANYDISQDEAVSITRLANGSYLKAETVLKSGHGDMRNFELFSQLMRLSYGTKIIELNAWVGEMVALGREKQKVFLIYALGLLRDNFMLNLVPDKQSQLVFLAQKELEFSQKFATFIHKKNIKFLNNELTKAYQHIERNGSDKIILLDMALKIVKLLRIKND